MHLCYVAAQPNDEKSSDKHFDIAQRLWDNADKQPESHIQ